MMFLIPLNNYQVQQFKKYSLIVSGALLSILVLGNVIMALISHPVKVSRDSYTVKEGFPLFTKASDYLDMVKHYPYDPGVKIEIRRLAPGESLWDIAARYHISIDTLVAANPFLASLNTADESEIVVPLEDGVLFAFRMFPDVYRMKSRLGYTGIVLGDYLPKIFRIISRDDMRLVFFKEAKPVLVNDSIARLYRYKNLFNQPVKGYYSSLFGERTDPTREGMEFHSGIDIQALMHTRVKAARDGIVIFASYREGYGNTIILQHEEGYQTLYAHLASMKVQVGDWCTKNQVIGTVGSTGRSTGPHLHFMAMRHGHTINPVYLIW